MNVFARFQVVENLGSGLSLVSSDIEPAAIVTPMHFLTRVTISTGSVHWRRNPHPKI